MVMNYSELQARRECHRSREYKQQPVERNQRINWMDTFTLAEGSKGTDLNDVPIAHTYFNSLPAELLAEIFQYLSLPSIQAFSSATKCFRVVAFPYLFKSVWLSASNTKEFMPGGSLHCIQDTVRHITLASVVRQSISIPHHRELTAAYFETCTSQSTLSLFPNLSSISIMASNPFDEDYNTGKEEVFFRRPLSNIVSHPIGARIKSVTLSDPFDTASSRISLPTEDVEEWKQANPGKIFKISQPQVIELYPLALENLKINSHSMSFRRPDLAVPFARPMSFPNLYLLSPVISQSLKRVEIETGCLRFVTHKSSRRNAGNLIVVHTTTRKNDEPEIIFPSVTELSVKFDIVRGDLIRGLSTCFPNVTKLSLLGLSEIEVPQVGIMPIIYPGMATFKKLKAFKSAWPLIPDNEWRILAEAIIGWVMSGLETLETAEFIHTSRFTRNMPGKAGTGIFFTIQDTGLGGWQLLMDVKYLGSERVNGTFPVIREKELYNGGEVYLWARTPEWTF
ncbi:hypothetical protein TWF730_006350 [Orbilia blumenaviensis]|uniref:F-box domain-containing protein n=1 Tax=Orbilia blumenaviensis TaxID=1796055 RepID=A0AAV9VGB7_9PEZI